MMKNICFFNSTQFWGGGEKAHLEYAENFCMAGYKVWVVCSKGSVLEERVKKSGLNFFSSQIGNFSFLNPRKKRTLANFFKKENIDTIYLNASNDIKIGGPAAKEAGVKNIVYMRGLAVPVKNSASNRYLFSKVLTHIVPNSFDTRKAFLTKLRPLLNENNVPVIYRGINFSEWDTRPVKKLTFKTNDEIILGNVGRLEKQKGQKHLIDIAKILQEKGLNFKIVIAGSGPLADELQTLVKKNKLEDKILLIGFQPDVKSFLNAIDIFVFPSLWEGFGNAMVEGMAEEVVPVAFNLTSNPEIITDGKNGFLIEYPNLSLFAEKIMFLAKHPRERKAMGELARKTVIKNFDLKKIIADWEQLLA